MNFVLSNVEPIPTTACFTTHGTVDLRAPKQTDVNFSLIAQALSRIARYNGLNGDAGGYSVAQHSIYGADALFFETGDELLAGYFLLHDAHEAYLGDIIEPTLNCLGRGARERLEQLKNRWDDVIYSEANLKSPKDYSEYNIIAEMDKRMLAFECRWFFPEQYSNVEYLKQLPIPQINGVPKVWGSMKAEFEFLIRLNRYLGVIPNDC